MKKLVTLSGWVIALFLLLLLINISNNDKEVIVNSTNKNNSDTLSMMYETEFGTGEYIVSSSLNWPDSQSYSFNPRLSKCENGGTLSWDSTTNQVIMTGDKSDKCYVYFDIAPYHVTCSDNTLACQIAKIYTSDGVNNLYYHDGYGDYTNSNLEAGDYSYRYAGGDYVLTDKAISEGYGKLASSSKSITDGLIFLYCDGVKSSNFSCSEESAVRTYRVGTGTTDYNTYIEAIDSAVSSGYLKNDNIKNYVCFGSTASTCPDENLYRIIGVFDDDGDGIYNVKLISADFASYNMLGDNSISGDAFSSATNYFEDAPYYGKLTSISDFYWNYANKQNTYNSTGYYNIWSYSYLNQKHLNGYYLNSYLSSTWTNKIATHNWVVGGNTSTNLLNYDAKIAYIYEVINPDTSIDSTYNAKVGLMYTSDYYYGAIPKYWSYGGWINDIGSYSSSINNNWLYLGGRSEWFITRHNSENKINYLGYNGTVAYLWAGEGWTNTVRPTFYLNSNVTLVSGTGTSTDPYVIN